MKKLISYFLIIISILGLGGCSKQYSSSSINLKSEYIKSFSPSFAIDADKVTKVSIDLYNQVISNKISGAGFNPQYRDFYKVDPQNADEKDFQDYIKEFAINYSTLELDNSTIKAEQYLRDSGSRSKDDYDIFMRKYKIKVIEDLKNLKLNLDNIMKYYE